MTHYLVQPRDRTFVKGYGFSPSAKTMARNIGKNICKKALNIAKTFLITLNNQPQMHLKLLQKEQFRKHQKQLVISFVIKLLTKLQKSHLKIL